MILIWYINLLSVFVFLTTFIFSNSMNPFCLVLTSHSLILLFYLVLIHVSYDMNYEILDSIKLLSLNNIILLCIWPYYVICEHGLRINLLKLELNYTFQLVKPWTSIFYCLVIWVIQRLFCFDLNDRKKMNQHDPEVSQIRRFLKHCLNRALVFPL